MIKTLSEEVANISEGIENLGNIQVNKYIRLY